MTQEEIQYLRNKSFKDFKEDYYPASVSLEISLGFYHGFEKAMGIAISMLAETDGKLKEIAARLEEYKSDLRFLNDQVVNKQERGF